MKSPTPAPMAFDALQRTITRALSMVIVVLLAVSTGCTSAPPTEPRWADPVLARRFDAAGAAFEQGLNEQAARMFGQAASRAYLCDDLPAIVEARYSEAVCLMRLRRFDDASAALTQADYAAALHGETSTVDITLLRARLAFEQGDFDTASSLARRTIADPAANPARVTDAHAVLGLVAIEKNDDAAASAAIAAMGAPDAPHSQADLAHLTGRLAMAQRRYADAAQAFDRETDARRQARSYYAMSRALALAADAYEKLNQPRDAATRLLRAGRSARQQGATDQAKQWLQRAASLADQAADKATAAIIRQVLDQLTTDTGKPEAS